MKKRLFASGFIAGCLLLLTGCHGYGFYETDGDVQSVYLFYYDNPDVPLVRHILWQPRREDFAFYRMFPLNTVRQLPPEQIPDLVEAISGSEFFHTMGQSSGPDGWVIMVHYEDGSFDILSQRFVGHYTKEGEFVRYFGRGDTSFRGDSQGMFATWVEQFFDLIIEEGYDGLH
ncbi:MAG: hypothetical protein FWF57_08670 [Defluviitaleaceae bacterium]|nr:hypothetical protein [Defluviitaleaceae bacterium]